MFVQNSAKFTKRSHKKSRNGCTTCKSRRVKCDETHPCCLNCQRRGTECVYLPVPKKKASRSSLAVPSPSNNEELDDKESPIQEIMNALNRESVKFEGLSYFGNMDDVEPLLVPPMLSFSPESTSSGSCCAGQNDVYGLNNMYDNQRQKPFNSQNLLDDYQPIQQPYFDSNLLSYSSIETPSSVPSNNDFFGVNLDTSLKELNDNGTDEILQQFMEEQKLTLSSNNAEIIFPSYIDNTKLNSQLADFFVNVVCPNLSSAPKMVNVWQWLVLLGFKYTYFHHIMMSLSSIVYYYDTLELQELELHTSKTTSKDYLLINQLNYAQYTKELKEIILQEKSIDSTEDLVCKMGSGILQLLHHVISPSLSIVDPCFYAVSATLCEYVLKKMPELDIRQDCKLNYYNPFFVPKMQLTGESFHPLYLYQLCNSPLTREDLFYNYDGVEEVMRNDREKFEASQVLVPDSEEEVEETLKFAISILIREYLLWSLEDNHEPDISRMVSRWPALAPLKFRGLIGQLDPRALILVAHFASLLGSTNSKLVPRSSMVTELTTIEGIIGPEWAPWLDVPKRMLQMV